MKLMSTGTIASLGFAREEQQTESRQSPDPPHTLDELTDSNCSPASCPRQQLAKVEIPVSGLFELVRDAGHQLSDSGQLFRTAHVLGDLPFFGEIADTDH